VSCEERGSFLICHGYLYPTKKAQAAAWLLELRVEAEDAHHAEAALAPVGRWQAKVKERWHGLVFRGWRDQEELSAQGGWTQRPCDIRRV
jgi:hypothetical protein